MLSINDSNSLQHDTVTDADESIRATLRETMKATIVSVMAKVHPKEVEHDPVLRCALVANCPDDIRSRIGTSETSFFPELQTLTKMRRTGTSDVPAR